MDEIYIFDDLVPKQYQDDIEHRLLGSTNIDWYLLDDITYNGKLDRLNLAKKTPALTHTFKNDQGATTKNFDFLMPIVYAACDRIDYHLHEVMLSRSFLSFSRNQPHVNNPHVDNFLRHIVVLYYVNDCDGDTVMYNQKYPEVGEQDVSTTEFTELKRITPKKGRTVVFDGSRYHSSSLPVESEIRCIINFDIR